MDLFKVFLLELDLLTDLVYFLLKVIDFLLVNVDWLQLPILLRKLVTCFHLGVSGLIGLASLQSRLLHSLLNTLQEVQDLVVYKVLVDLHFALKVAHFTFIDKL